MKKTLEKFNKLASQYSKKIIKEQEEDFVDKEEDLDDDSDLETSKINDTDEGEEEFGPDEDGWPKNIFEDQSLLDDLDAFTYEIRNCVRGSSTNAKTRKELSEYLRTLADRLNTEADNLEG